MFGLFRKPKSTTTRGWVVCWEPTTINQSSKRLFLRMHPTYQTLQKTPHLNLAAVFSTKRSAHKACRDLAKKNYGTPIPRPVTVTSETN